MFAAMLVAVPLAAQMTLPVEELDRQDQRLTRLAERMFVANAVLCRNRSPMTGMVLHGRDQYPAGEAAARFGEYRLGVAMVLPGSPAEQAGIRAGDAITAIGATNVSSLSAQGGDLLRDVAWPLITDGTVLSLRRDGADVPATVSGPAGCAGTVEINTVDRMGARTDGRIVQVDYGLARRVDDDGLAVVFSHEFAHLVLEHRRRLQALGVSKGFFAEFGRNGRLNRQMEEEADMLSVHLLANAGYDPAIAPAFWRSDLGRDLAGGLLRSRTHPSASARAQALEREIATNLGMERPALAPHLLMLRD